MGGHPAHRKPDALQRSHLFQIDVATESPTATIELQGRGASWIELPTAVHARPVPTLLAQTRSTKPGALTTSTHAFTFNDDEWNVASFAGDLSRSSRFAVAIDERVPAFAYAWVEAYTAPFLHDVYRGRPADARKILDSPIMTLSQDGLALASAGVLLVGSAAVATTKVDPELGPLTLEVEPNGTLWPQSFPCGEAGNGPEIRFTLPVETDVWVLDPVPAAGSTFVAAS